MVQIKTIVTVLVVVKFTADVSSVSVPQKLSCLNCDATTGRKCIGCYSGGLKHPES